MDYKQILEDILELDEKVTINYNFCYKSYTDIIKISTFLYKQSNIYLIRKKDKFDEILNLYENHKNKNSKRWN